MDYICVQCTVGLVSQLIHIILLYEETHQEALLLKHLIDQSLIIWTFCPGLYRKDPACADP